MIFVFRHCRSVVQCAWLFINLIVISTAVAQSAPTTIFIEPTSSAAARESDDSSSWVLRERLYNLDARALVQLINDNGIDSVPLRVRVPLFDGTSLIASLNSISRTQAGNINLRGTIENSSESLVTLMLTPDHVLVGSVTTDGNQYQIRYRGNGLHGLQDIDETVYRPELPPRRPSLNSNAQGRVLRPLSRESAAADINTIIDVMVIYTRKSRTNRSGTSAIKAEIDLAIREANIGYSNSNVSQQLRLVHSGEVDYTAQYMTQSLEDVTDGDTDSEGPLDAVHGLRNTYGADLVMLITPDRDYCGIAWIMDTLSTAFEDAAFSVVADDCLVTGSGFSSGYVVSHELGHNLGLAHDRITNDSSGLHAYSHGYINATAGWRTIMAYDQCTTGECPAVNYYSNPDIKYNGAPMGIVAGASNAADNARTLNLTATTVAAFRSLQSVTPPSIVTPIPGSTLSGDTQTFTWTSNDTNVASWGLTIGTTNGAADIFNRTGLTGTSVTVNNLPVRNERLFVTLSYVVGDTTNNINYEYDATSLAFIPVININGVVVDEDDAVARVTLSLSTVANAVVSVIVTTENQTALAGEDYSAVTKTISFPVGQDTHTVNIPIINDSKAESTDETFTVNLSAANGASIGTASAVVTIKDDDNIEADSYADITMTLDTLVDTVYGHRIEGVGARDGLRITFYSDGNDARLTFNSYDVDQRGEVSVWLNDTFVATARVGNNNQYNGGDVILLDKERLNANSNNTILIKQKIRGWRWGLKNLLLTQLQAGPETSIVSGQIKRAPRGWNFGRNSHLGAVVFNFPGASIDQYLYVTGYDIDNKTEATVFLNGRRIGALRAGPDNALNSGNRFRLKSELQHSGNNRLVIVQKRPSYTWGVRDVELQ